MQSDRLAVASAWMAASARDLRAAERLRDEEPSLACFHAQQGAEKALKAAAVVASGDVQRSPSLIRVLGDLTAASVAIPEPVVRACKILERYFASTRYPDALGDIDPGDVYTVADAIETYDLADDVVKFVRSVIVGEASLEEHLVRLVKSGFIECAPTNKSRLPLPLRVPSGLAQRMLDEDREA